MFKKIIDKYGLKIFTVLFVGVSIVAIAIAMYWDYGTGAMTTYSGYGVTFNYTDNFRPSVDRHIGLYDNLNKDWQKMTVNGKEIRYRTFERLIDLRDDPDATEPEYHRESDTVCTFYEFSVSSLSDLVKTFKTDNMIREKIFMHAPKLGDSDEPKEDVNSYIVNESSTTVNSMHAYWIIYNFQSYYHNSPHDFTGIVTFIETPWPKYYAIQYSVISSDNMDQFNYYTTIVDTFKAQ